MLSQPFESQTLRACLHFLLHPALKPAEKRQLALSVQHPTEALQPEPPAGCSISADRWAHWCSPLGRINVALELTVEWLQAQPSNGQARHAISFWDERYPGALAHVDNPPWLLLAEGHWPACTEQTLAVVGSRSPTVAGLRRARSFSCAMAQAGWTIVSGLARGIDAAAHQGALDARAPTLAVLGCGIDITYPPEHTDLRAAILTGGGTVMSEYPPGVAPQDRFFPQRNRIIAGLSRGVLVVEAAVRSGSLITARQANEAGRAVMAIPGSIDLPQSRGCHQMIRAGAALVETVDDILAELNPSSPLRQTARGAARQTRQSLRLDWSPRPAGPTRPNQPANRLSDSHAEGLHGVSNGDALHADCVHPQLLGLFSGQAMQFDDLSTLSGLPAAELSAALLDLELSGALERRPGQWWAPC